MMRLLPRLTIEAATTCDDDGTWEGHYIRLTWGRLSIEWQVTVREVRGA